MRIATVLGLAALLTARAGVGPVGGAPATDASPHAAETLAFERNEGQTDPRVAFVARPRGVTLYLEPAAATFAWADASIRMRAVGAAADAVAHGAEGLPGKVNYLIGRDPSLWRTGVPTFARVATPAVYPGIGLAWYGAGRDAEYDFDVAPGADPARIRLAFDGADTVVLEPSGDLVARVAGHELRQRKPTVFEVTGGVRREISGRFVVGDDRIAAFEVERRDPSARLVIDPLAIAWSDFVGGGRRDACRGVALDGSKNPVVAGRALSLDFPVTPGAYDTSSAALPDEFSHDVFVTKFKADGSAVIFSTYLGGTADDDVRSVALTSSGEPTVCGATHSEDFPVDGFDQVPDDVPNSGSFTSDGFVARLAADGASLRWSTFLGGSTGQEEANDLAVDAQGLTYVTGWTSSSDFPVSQGALQPDQASGSMDAFFTVVAADGGTLAYSTYLGGAASDEGQGIARDTDGNVYVVGVVETFGPEPLSFTGTPAVRAFAGFRDYFAVKITAQRAFSWMTFLGGEFDEEPVSGYQTFLARIAADASGGAYVAGNTNSSDYPVGQAVSAQNDQTQDAVVTRLSPAGEVVWSRYFGGNSGSEEAATGIVVDSEGRPNICGYTAGGTGFPLVEAAQTVITGGIDAFYAVLAADGSGVLRSTFIGGSADDRANGLAVAGDGTVCVVGETDSTLGLAKFPIVGGTQRVPGGSEDDGYPRDGFVAKLTTGAGGEVDEFRVVKGTITDSTKFFKDKAAFGGTLPVPASFDPRPFPVRLMLATGGREEGFDVFIGDVEANDARWKEKKGKYTLKYAAPGDAIHITLVVDPKKGLFAVEASNFSYSFPVANPIRFDLSFGQTFTYRTTRTWTQKGTKFKVP